MKKVITLLSLIAAMMVSASCVAELDEPLAPNVTVREDGRYEVKMTFGVSTPSNLAQVNGALTKSSVPDDVAVKIHNITVWAFVNGRFDATASQIYKSPADFSMAFVPNKEYTLYFLANVDKEAISGIELSTKLITEAKLQSMLYGNSSVYKSMSTYGLPLAKVYKNWVAGVSSAKFELDKLVARYQLTVDRQRLQNMGITFKSICVKQAAKYATPFKDDYSATSSEDVFGGDTFGDYASQEDIDKLNQDGKVNLYMFENIQGDLLNGDAEAKDKVITKIPEEKRQLCTYLEVKADVKTKVYTGETTYRVCLGGRPGTFPYNFDIIRNTDYRLEMDFVTDEFTDEDWRIENNGVARASEIFLSKSKLNLMLDIPDTLYAWTKDTDGNIGNDIPLELDLTEIRRHNPFMTVREDQVSSGGIRKTRFIINAHATTCDDPDTYYGYLSDGHKDNTWMDPTVYDLWEKVVSGSGGLTPEEEDALANADYFGSWDGLTRGYDWRPAINDYGNFDKVKHNVYEVGVKVSEQYQDKLVSEKIKVTKWNQYFPILFAAHNDNAVQDFMYVCMQAVNPFHWKFEIRGKQNMRYMEDYDVKKNLFGTVTGISLKFNSFDEEYTNRATVCIDHEGEVWRTNVIPIEKMGDPRIAHSPLYNRTLSIDYKLDPRYEKYCYIINEKVYDSSCCVNTTPAERESLKNTANILYEGRPDPYIKIQSFLYGYDHGLPLWPNKLHFTKGVSVMDAGYYPFSGDAGYNLNGTLINSNAVTYAETEKQKLKWGRFGYEKEGTLIINPVGVWSSRRSFNNGHRYEDDNYHRAWEKNMYSLLDLKGKHLDISSDADRWLNSYFCDHSESRRGLQNVTVAHEDNSNVTTTFQTYDYLLYINGVEYR